MTTWRLEPGDAVDEQGVIWSDTGNAQGEMRPGDRLLTGKPEMRFFSLGESDECRCHNRQERRLMNPEAHLVPGTPVMRCSAGASDKCLTQHCECFKP